EGAGHRRALHGPRRVRQVAQGKRRPQPQDHEGSWTAEAVKLSRDAWTGLVVLAASLFLFYLTLELKDNPLVPIGPGFYPRVVLGITAVLAGFLLVFSLI